MHHVKGEKVNSLDGGDVFPGHVGKVISGVLNRDFVGDYGVLHRLQRRRPNSCNESQETQHSFTNYNHLNIFLGATKHLYNWLCPSVGWSVGLCL